MITKELLIRNDDRVLANATLATLGASARVFELHYQLRIILTVNIMLIMAGILITLFLL